MLIDSHTHVHFPQFDKDRDEVIKRSFDAGVLMINVGTNLTSSEDAINLAEKYPDKLWATVGIHPNDTEQHSHILKNVRMLLELAQQNEVVAVGETGLDFYRTKEKDKQKSQFESFEQHIALANKVGKPMTIHIRNAYKEAAEFLKQHRVEKGGVMHCFGGSTEEARAFLDLGFYISFAGNIAYGDNLVETVRYVPLDRLLVETDAPYLAPVPHRGKRNEPVYVELVAKRVAEMKHISLKEVANQTMENVCVLFQIKPV